MITCRYKIKRSQVLSRYLTNVLSSHSAIYEGCVERNLGQKIRLLLRRQSFVKQPLQTHKLVHVPGEELLLGRSSAQC